MLKLLSDITKSGGANFITSAVEQQILDQWAETPQGSEVAPFLTEILGARPGCVKGPEHFAYIAKKIGHHKIYYVADARFEIETGRGYAEEFDIVPIGFAHRITGAHVLEACSLLHESLSQQSQVGPPDKVSALLKALPVIDAAKLALPDDASLLRELSDSGAEVVVTGSAREITKHLRATLVEFQTLS